MIIPERVWKRLGGMAPGLAPLMWGDHEYNLRALRGGFQNVIYPLRYRSDVEWGTTRVKARDSEWTRKFNLWALQNRRYVWRMHGPFIRKYLKEHAASLASPAFVP